MTRERRVALVVLLLVLVAAGALAVAMSRKPAPPASHAAERPTLLLLTSLPLLFGEDFSLQGGGSPALSALEQRYRVVPISVTSKPDLAKGRLLLMAQPLAQTAEDLVTLDQWVRQGGRVLLLADPMLEWPSSRPLGDRLRPPAMFADTGLLRHWGLRLDAPDERGPAQRKLGPHQVLTASPGLLFGRCAISKDRLVAHCRVGQGKATVVADADVLDVASLDGPTERNLDAVISELSSLER